MLPVPTSMIGRDLFPGSRAGASDAGLVVALREAPLAVLADRPVCTLLTYQVVFRSHNFQCQPIKAAPFRAPTVQILKPINPVFSTTRVRHLCQPLYFIIWETRDERMYRGIIQRSYMEILIEKIMTGDPDPEFILMEKPCPASLCGDQSLPMPAPPSSPPPSPPPSHPIQPTSTQLADISQTY